MITNSPSRGGLNRINCRARRYRHCRNLAGVPGEKSKTGSSGERIDERIRERRSSAPSSPGTERIDVTRLFDHSVEGNRRRERRGRSLGVVRLGFDRVAEWAQPKQVRVGGKPRRRARKAEIRSAWPGKSTSVVVSPITSPIQRISQMLAELAPAGSVAVGRGKLPTCKR